MATATSSRDAMRNSISPVKTPRRDSKACHKRNLTPMAFDRDLPRPSDNTEGEEASRNTPIFQRPVGEQSIIPRDIGISSQHDSRHRGHPGRPYHEISGNRPPNFKKKKKKKKTIKKLFAKVINVFKMHKPATMATTRAMGISSASHSEAIAIGISQETGEARTQTSPSIRLVTFINYDEIVPDLLSKDVYFKLLDSLLQQNQIIAPPNEDLQVELDTVIAKSSEVALRLRLLETKIDQISAAQGADPETLKEVVAFCVAAVEKLQSQLISSLEARIRVERAASRMAERFSMERKYHQENLDLVFAVIEEQEKLLELAQDKLLCGVRVKDEQNNIRYEDIGTKADSSGLRVTFFFLRYYDELKLFLMVIF
ncbi:hypothetical protein K440DRAFT_644986 [Wilcoxina mikolae CBS 423.85]|nr:hypothetical protein K440DRAFT_644986 [Wilcoxina mikolae CBS 423.85]